ncbi:MAG: tRNA 2-thiouridine(34) synthase MnmA [Chloroflexi bacterium]|nr:tRNA 2-thiouridine(34) synthase MnmA [Chloroflexota bacterium]
MPERIVVAMSGGVDSSVAALLCKEQGYDVIGITMRLWTEARPAGFSGRTQCCGVEDIDDARRIAQQTDIPHYVLNLEKPFRTKVVDHFVGSYARGRTPNPCLECNTHIKFDAFFQRAMALGADYIATGHYARRVEGPGGAELHRALDAGKDQSYVLYTLPAAVRARTLFPLGELHKDDVRAIAKRHGLAVAEKPDSADICFVPGGDYRDFLARYLPDRPGAFVDRDGRRLGEHQGAHRFTIGQRRGLGLALGAPAFVTAIDPARNAVELGAQDDLRVAGLRAAGWRWLIPAPAEPMDTQVKLRYRAAPVPALLYPAGPNAGDTVWIRLRAPAGAVAPGQAAVCYDGSRVIAGGTIERTVRDWDQTPLARAVSSF